MIWYLWSLAQNILISSSACMISLVLFLIMWLTKKIISASFLKVLLCSCSRQEIVGPRFNCIHHRSRNSPHFSAVSHGPHPDFNIRSTVSDATAIAFHHCRCLTLLKVSVIYDPNGTLTKISLIDKSLHKIKKGSFIVQMIQVHTHRTIVVEVAIYYNLGGKKCIFEDKDIGLFIKHQFRVSQLAAVASLSECIQYLPSKWALGYTFLWALGYG